MNDAGPVAAPKPMGLGTMFDNAMNERSGFPLTPLIDMGYVNAQSARDRADRIFAAKILPKKKSLEIGGFGRLLIRVPPKKLAALLAAFPEIKEGSTYFGTTHNWLDAESRDLKHAAGGKR